MLPSSTISHPFGVALAAAIQWSCDPVVGPNSRRLVGWRGVARGTARFARPTNGSWKRPFPGRWSVPPLRWMARSTRTENT